MALVTPLFIDTSVLIAGTIDFGKSSAAPMRLLDGLTAQSDSPMTAWHCCLEFFAVTTRLPPEYRLAPADARLLLEENILSRWHIRALPEPHRREFLRQCADDRVAGGRLYDAHIAEIARRANAGTVVTENRRHFTSLLRHGVRVLTATEAVAAST